MSTVLFTWELGGGLGHVGPHRPILDALAHRGHRVYVALRDVTRASVALAGVNVGILQAPFRESRGAESFAPPLTYAHILHNIGFGHPGDLRSLTDAWRSLYHLVRPDLIVADHSPTALLAARGAPARLATIGTGFLCPPDTFPMPHLLRPWSRADPDQLVRDERAVLGNANDLLASRRLPPMDRLGQLYGDVERTFLTTYAELDHFGARPGCRYWGTWTPAGIGGDAVWPAAAGSRIYAYLKPFDGLSALLDVLGRSALPTLAVVDGVDPAIVARHQNETLRFEPRPLDLVRVAATCDIAVLNANHSTMATLLLAGKPCLLLPIFMEQSLLAARAEALGAARTAGVAAGDGEAVTAALQDMLASIRYREKAQAFAARQRATSDAERVAAVVAEMQDILDGKPSPRHGGT